eukprot:3230900-Rhodomonas_salina.1
MCSLEQLRAQVAPDVEADPDRLYTHTDATTVCSPHLFAASILFQRPPCGRMLRLERSEWVRLDQAACDCLRVVRMVGVRERAGRGGGRRTRRE